MYMLWYNGIKHGNPNPLHLSELTRADEVPHPPNKISSSCTSQPCDVSYVPDEGRHEEPSQVLDPLSCKL